ncbi:phenylacetic acid degradation protein PaaN [Streptomyces profundus]|uniref:phenylacetic acid degradation protein PaaN n=1 Tax=Streptomyces profundus TaxID=2867410 RepID=UPI001D160EA7|nr:phenylacetic acid degradation protein PaaN [Streptomyces sp. MA3_2.13]UED88158.1 phenylacetic acid degradation protein PaaN [Streptomyces sp. MA3_2.13]
MTEYAAEAEAGSVDFFVRHRELLRRAVDATRSREFWSPFPESPSERVYGAGSAAAGEAAFRALLNERFAVPGWGGGEVGEATEVSPYGFALGVRYPAVEPGRAVALAREAGVGWRAASPDVRAGVAVEILTRLNAASFEVAHAVRHTTGQPFVMAFQAGGPHAQERGLEAVAYAWAEQSRHPGSAAWAKPRRGGEPLALEKTFTPVGRGVAVLIGCNTFPTWNGYPGLFASLVTGNPVVVKPHPRAVLPLAITVRVAREVLVEAGFAPDVVVLAAEPDGAGTARELATHPEVRIVDFTGSTEFGDWLEANARQAQVYTEKAGLNTVVLDSTDDYAGLLRNLAFSLSLYSGQMCTTPQNLLVGRGGIVTDRGVRSPAEFATDLGAAVERLLADEARATGTLGAIVGDGVRARLAEAARLPGVCHASRAVPHPDFPEAVARTPLIALLDAAADREVFTREWFGPVSFVVVTESTAQSVGLLRETVGAFGALTALVHSTDEAVLDAAREAALAAGVHLSENLTDGVFVNQSSAFSDFHGSAANPAASATLTDPAFVAGRFAVVQSRRPVSAGASDAAGAS